MLHRSGIDDHGHYIELRYAGEVDLPGMLFALTEVHELCQARHLRGALADFREAEGTLTGLERFELATKLAPAWRREICLSIVLASKQSLPGRIGELAAQNRGVRVRVFNNREAAAAWLEAALR